MKLSKFTNQVISKMLLILRLLLVTRASSLVTARISFKAANHSREVGPVGQANARPVIVVVAAKM
jgi:hypothetical protein